VNKPPSTAREARQSKVKRKKQAGRGFFGQNETFAGNELPDPTEQSRRAKYITLRRSLALVSIFHWTPFLSQLYQIRAVLSHAPQPCLCLSGLLTGC
jgi:hypothetical protein